MYCGDHPRKVFPAAHSLLDPASTPTRRAQRADPAPVASSDCQYPVLLGAADRPARKLCALHTSQQPTEGGWCGVVTLAFCRACVPAQHSSARHGAHQSDVAVSQVGRLEHHLSEDAWDLRSQAPLGVNSSHLGGARDTQHLDCCPFFERCVVPWLAPATVLPCVFLRVFMLVGRRHAVCGVGVGCAGARATPHHCCPHTDAGVPS